MGAPWSLGVTAAFVVDVCPHLFGRAVVTWTSLDLTSVEHHRSCRDKEPSLGRRQLGFEPWFHHLLLIEREASFLTF